MDGANGRTSDGDGTGPEKKSSPKRWRWRRPRDGSVVEFLEIFLWRFPESEVIQGILHMIGRGSARSVGRMVLSSVVLYNTISEWITTMSSVFRSTKSTGYSVDQEKDSAIDRVLSWSIRRDQQ